MDSTATSLCMDNNIAIRIFNINNLDNLDNLDHSDDFDEKYSKYIYSPDSHGNDVKIIM